MLNTENIRSPANVVKWKIISFKDTIPTESFNFFSNPSQKFAL